MNARKPIFSFNREVIILLLAFLIGLSTFYFLSKDNESSLRDSDLNSTQKSINFKPNELALAYEDTIVHMIEKTSPAVVSIIMFKDVPIVEQYYEDANNPFFNLRIPRYREKGKEKRQVGGGSGFIVSADGYVVTNKHVVSDKEAEYKVFLSDGKEYDTKVVARDPFYDIAVLKIDVKDVAFLDFSDSDKLKVGQTAIAIGNPLLEFTNSVSTGIISGLARSIIAGDARQQMSEQLEDVIQTDAAINPGNSGGPLLNLQGEVIGMNVATTRAENIGFALPANVVKAVSESVKQNGKIVRPYLGVRYVAITKELQTAQELPVDYGVWVTPNVSSEGPAIVPNSPATKAGIKEGDIILEIDGVKIEKDRSFTKIIATKHVSDTIELKVLRDEKEISLKVTLENIPES